MLTLKRKHLGFTIYELFIVLSIVLIITTLAMPYMGKMMIKSDLKSAEAAVIKSLRMAKTLAKTHNQTINVQINKETQTIQLIKKDGSIAFLSKMPAKTKIIQNQSFIYSPLGTINKLGEIKIQSVVDQNKHRKVEIVSLIGQLANG